MSRFLFRWYRNKAVHNGIELVLVLPHPNHDAQWDARSRSRMAFLEQHCTDLIAVGTIPGADSYYKRNRYLVDHNRSEVLPAEAGTGTH